LKRLRSARSAPCEISTPRGWKWPSAPRFSGVVVANGSGECASTWWTSASSSTSTIRRPGTGRRSGADPYRDRSRCRVRTRRWSASAFSASATSRGLRMITPRATTGTTAVPSVSMVSSTEAVAGAVTATPAPAAP
jgi:hypothetical protein